MNNELNDALKSHNKDHYADKKNREKSAKREKFAESAMIAIFNDSVVLTNIRKGMFDHEPIEKFYKEMAQLSVKMADALIAELEKEKE